MPHSAHRSTPTLHTQMNVRLQGHGAARGTALGRAWVRQMNIIEIQDKYITDTNAELHSLYQAMSAARQEIQVLRERMHGTLSHEVGEFLDLYTLLIDDPELLRSLNELILTHNYSAEYALKIQRDHLTTEFEAMEDHYLKSRMDDLNHVLGRIHAFLKNTPPNPKMLQVKSSSATTSPHPNWPKYKPKALLESSSRLAIHSRTAPSWRIACTCH